MDSMKIALSGLNTFNTAMGTTSHNIANAHTEGYSRQRVTISANEPQAGKGFFLGNGADVLSVQRITNAFANDQLQMAGSEQQRLEMFNNYASRIDSMLAEQNTSLTPAMQSFFNSINELSTDPASISLRQQVLDKAEAMTATFQTQHKQVALLRDEVNGSISTEIDEINAITKNIANLNVAILNSGAEGTLAAPNDLLDKQDQLVQELAEHIAINTLRLDNGMIDVHATTGITLVSTNHAISLDTGRDPADPTKTTVLQNGYDIAQKISGGSLGGILDFRREMLDPTANEIGRLATTLGITFNAQHAKGMDLYENLGADFFNLSSPMTVPHAQNTGNASITATITDPTTLTASDYMLEYNGTDFDVITLPSNTTSTTSLPATIGGVEFTLTGTANTGDRFIIRPVANGAKNFSVALNNTKQIAASSPMRAEAQVTNLGDGEIFTPRVIDADNPNLFDSMTLRFTSTSTYNVVDDSGAVVSSETYASNDEIDLNGLRFKIVGAPASGDEFRLEFNSGGTSDNTNSQYLNEVQFEKVIGGHSSVQEGYAGMVSQVGSLTRQTGTLLDAQDNLLRNAQARRDSISAVDLDEEAINLTKYQEAYEAAAQVIAISKQLFQTLLDATGR